jgi:hypothetical protein
MWLANLFLITSLQVQISAPPSLFAASSKHGKRSIVSMGFQLATERSGEQYMPWPSASTMVRIVRHSVRRSLASYGGTFLAGNTSTWSVPNLRASTFQLSLLPWRLGVRPSLSRYTLWGALSLIMIIRYDHGIVGN